MFLGNREKKTQPGGIVGIDLGESFAQISYWLPGAEKPDTLSKMTGGDEVLIPTVLLKWKDKEGWTYGKEALEAAGAGLGQAVDDLLGRALRQEQVLIGGEVKAAEELLLFFLKRILYLLGGMVRPDKAGMIVLTLPQVSPEGMALGERLRQELGLAEGSFVCTARPESFFAYLVNQPQELWKNQGMICDFDGECMRFLRLSTQVAEGIKTAQVKEYTFPELTRPTGNLNVEDSAKMDEIFIRCLEENLGEDVVDTVFLIGTGFGIEWYQRSLDVLCRGRRVFLGNNLYSKGACYLGRGRLVKSGTAEGFAAGPESSFLYLGKDMLKAGLVLKGQTAGKDVKIPLLKAGDAWYESQVQVEFLLDEDLAFTLEIHPLVGSRDREVLVTLDELPKRPGRTTRIELKVDCPEPNRVRLSMEDLGFGEFFPATHKTWEETFVI